MQAIYLGDANDTPVAGDFDGDGWTDLAVYRAQGNRWLIRSSATGTLSEDKFGQPNEVPMLGDFDGDGKADLLGWSAARGTLRIERSSDQKERPLTITGQTLSLGDYDGDGKSDGAIWLPTGWQLYLSSRDWVKP